MKKPTYKALKVFRTAFGVSLLSVSLSGKLHADSSLPFIGLKSNACKVNKVNSVLDGGFLTDEACEILFVRPPSFGTLKSIELSPSTNVSKCNATNTVNAAQIANLVFMEEYSSIKNVLEKKLKDAKEAGNIALVSSIQEKLDNANEMLDVFKTSVEVQESAIDYASSKYGGPIRLQLKYYWSELVEKYRKANPNFTEVKALPITKGYLSYDMSNPLENATSLGRNPVIDLLKTSLPMAKKSISDLDSLGDISLLRKHNTKGPTAELLRDVGVLQVNLNLLGICPFLDGGEQSSPLAGFTPAFTYHFPVATSSLFNVELKAEYLAGAVTELAEKGVVNSAELASALSKFENQIFKNENSKIENDASIVSEESRSKAKKRLLSYIANSALRNLGVLVKAIPRSNSQDVVTQGSGCGYLGRKACVYNYQISKSAPNWVEIAQKIQDQLNTQGSGSADSQVLFYEVGTMLFVPHKDLPKLEKKYSTTKAD